MSTLTTNQTKFHSSSHFVGKRAWILILSTAVMFTVGFLTPCVDAAPKEEKLDKVIAIVDDDVVLQSEFDDRMAMVMERLKGQYTQLPDMNAVKKQILDQLILERIELQTADKYEIKIEDQEIDRAIQNIMRNKNMNSEQLVDDLKKQGLSMAGLRKQIENEIKLDRLQQGVVNGRIKISAQEVDNFLASNAGKLATSADYHIGHILIAFQNGTSSESIAEAEKKANDIYEQLKKGGDFAQLAIANSNDQAALKGGDIGWRKLAELPELFIDKVSTMKEGEFSEPIRSGAGFHIVKVLEIKNPTQTLVQQTHARHILIKTSEILDDSQARDKLMAIRDRIEKGEDFAKLARQYSEDTGSMLSGGDLGWSTPGMFVPAFEQAMDETPVGKICRPFKSSYGWHIIQVLDRRQEDMSEQMKRNQAMNILRSRRFDEELQLWIAQLRSDAYIDIKDENAAAKKEVKTESDDEKKPTKKAKHKRK